MMIWGFFAKGSVSFRGVTRVLGSSSAALVQGSRPVSCDKTLGSSSGICKNVEDDYWPRLTPFPLPALWKVASKVDPDATHIPFSHPTHPHCPILSSLDLVTTLINRTTERWWDVILITRLQEIATSAL